MYGLIQFAKKAEDENIKPVLGSLIDDPKDDKLAAVFIAKNNRGYAELCKIITARKLKDDFLLSDAINNSSGDLFIISSSIDLIKGINFKKQLKKNFFVELISTKSKRKSARELYNYALNNGLQIVASQPAYFETPDDYLLHKVLRAIKLNTTISLLSDDEIADEEYYLRTPKEMKEIWRALPEALWNAKYIAQNSNVNLKFGEYKFPLFPLPPGETAFSYLWKITFRGLEERYHPITEKAVKRRCRSRGRTPSTCRRCGRADRRPRRRRPRSACRTGTAR